MPHAERPHDFETAIAIAGKRTDWWDRAVPNLHMRVAPSGRRTWRYRLVVAGRPTIVKLGEHRRREQGGADGDRFLNVSQARTAARKVLGRVEAGSAPVRRANALTVQEMIAEVRRDREDQLAPRTRRTYDTQARAIARVIGDRHADELTEQDVVSFRAEVSRTSGERMAQHCLSRLRYWFKLAIRTQAIRRKDNPTEGVKVGSRPPNRSNTLTEDQHAGMLRAIDELEAEGAASPGVADGLRLLIWQGLRLSDVEGLRWREVDLAAGELRIEQHKSARQHGAKVLPLREVSIAMLRRRSEGLAGGDPVFDTFRGPATSTQLTRVWKLAAARVGTEATPHAARRCFITRLARSGVDLETTRSIVGHRHPATTLGYYATATRDTQTRALAKLDEGAS